jgi:hypothetical protein
VSAHLKTSRGLLPSAQRSANTSTAIQQDAYVTYVRAYLNVTVASGTGGLSVVFRGYDKYSGNSVELTTGGDAVSQTGTYAYEMGLSPSAAFGTLLDAASRSVPYRWDALVKHLDGSSYTYSLSVETLA